MRTKIFAALLAILLSAYSVSADTTPFDHIRPLANEGFDILKQNGDSTKALALLTQALVRGQDWAESDDENRLMASIVANTIQLRAKLKNEPPQRLMMELMVMPQISTVNRDKNTYGGSPSILPEIGVSSNDLSDYSIASSIRKAIDLMATDRLKDAERLLLALYTHTWTRGLDTKWRHPVANKLGLLYLRLGTTDNAIDILRQNKIDMDLLMKADPDIDYCETIIYLAYAYRQEDTKIIWKCFLETANEIAAKHNLKIDTIIDDFKRIFKLDDKTAKKENELESFIRSNDSSLAFLTESQREKRWDKLKERWGDLKYSLLDSEGKVKNIDDCLNAFQYEKQIMLRSTVKTMDALRKSDDKEAISLTDSLINIRRKLAACYSFEEDRLMADYERTQKALLHHHVMNGFENHLYSMLTTDSIAGKLSGNEIFIDFGTLETNEGERYFAILISSDIPKGKIIPLCTVSEFESFMKDTYVDESRKMVELRYGSEFLYENIWKPLCSGGLLKKKIYYCPTGMLGLIMPEAITYDGRYVGEDFEFHIISSAEALAGAKESMFYKPQSLYSFCAIDYYCERLALIANANMYGADRKVYMPSLERDTDMGSIFSDSRSIPPLHKPEDFEWLKALCESHNMPALIPTGFNASEHAFKFLSGKDVGVLNIVTHAFSMPKTLRPLEKAYFSSLTMKTRFNDKMESEYLPLYRSGFMLSGAERAWCDRNIISGIEDGVVNGEELASLDLNGVDLLTLIACDTGNGDIDPAEGIMGLRRALKLAGCKTLVTTAWNLDKEAGDAYLQEFYTNLLEGNGIPAAHRSAQLELLKRFDNPYYWAVFQLID